MGALGSPGWRTRLRRCSVGLFRSDPHSAMLSWLGGERIAISGLPAPGSVPGLAGQGVTHVVNCRARPQVRLSGDLTAERAAFPGRVAHAPMWDLGQRQRPGLWAEAAAFAARALAEDPQARVLIHCHWGRRRSAMVAYAVLRLRGHARDAAAALVLTHRPQAELVPAYVRSVERWLAAQPPAVRPPAPGVTAAGAAGASPPADAPAGPDAAAGPALSAGPAVAAMTATAPTT
jgi:protein-tyrosine phosphatase